MKLSKQQIEYVTARLETISKAKIEKAVGVFNEQEVKPLDDEEKLKLIFQGTAKQAKLKPENEVDRYTHFTDAYDYPEHKKKLTEYVRRIKEYEGRKKIAAAAEAKRVTKIMDKIMLSQNADAALELVDKYDTE